MLLAGLSCVGVAAVLAGVAALRAGGWFRRADVVLAMGCRFDFRLPLREPAPAGPGPGTVPEPRE